MKQPPNLMLLVGEDVGRDQGCYGDAFARTPNLDRLAAEGCRFTNAWSTCPVCAPSRSAMVTGQDPRKIGTHLMRCTLLDPPRLFMHELRDAGYFVNWANKTDFNFYGGFSASGNSPAPGTPDAFADAATDWREDLAAGDLPDRPWLFFYNFNTTHESGMWPPGAEPAVPAEEPRRDDASLDHSGGGLPGLVVPPYLPDTRTTRASLVRYHDHLEEQDRQIGRVLDDLDQSGQAENTVVIYLSDHGRGLVREKRWCYPAGLRMPLIVRAPTPAPETLSGSARGIAEPGTVRDDLVSWIDLAPTLLSLAGVAAPEQYDGRVFLGGHTQAEPPCVFFGRDRMDEAQDRVRGASDRQFLYLRNDRPDIPQAQRNAYMETSPVTTEIRRLHRAGQLAPPAGLWMAPTKPEEELYDLTADPHAVDNLAALPDHGEALKRLRQAVAGWCERIDDKGATPESDLVANGVIEDQRDFYHGRAGQLPADLDPDGTYATRYDPDRA